MPVTEEGAPVHTGPEVKHRYQKKWFPFIGQTVKIRPMGLDDFPDIFIEGQEYVIKDVRPDLLALEGVPGKSQPSLHYWPIRYFAPTSFEAQKQSSSISSREFKDRGFEKLSYCSFVCPSLDSKTADNIQNYLIDNMVPSFEPVIVHADTCTYVFNMDEIFEKDLKNIIPSKKVSSLVSGREKEAIVLLPEKSKWLHPIEYGKAHKAEKGIMRWLDENMPGKSIYDAFNEGWIAEHDPNTFEMKAPTQGTLYTIEKEIENNNMDDGENVKLRFVEAPTAILNVGVIRQKGVLDAFNEERESFGIEQVERMAVIEEAKK
jgi:hypothetical protein